MAQVSGTQTAALADAERPLGIGPTTSNTAFQTPAFSPLYRQIKTLILSALQTGQWRPGEAIPSESDLAVRYQVSQGTVRRAIDELAADNLLRRRQGKGTFVATHTEQQVEYRFLKLAPDRGGPSSEGPAERHVIECRRLSANSAVAHGLRVAMGSSVLQVRRVLSFRHVPTILETLWLPADPFKGLTTERLATYQGSMYALFETEFGVRMVRADEKIRAVVADPRQAEWLQVPALTPLLSVERIAYTYHDAPMELRHGWYRTDSHYYHNELG